MGDITLIWDPVRGCADFGVGQGDLKTGDTLRTAVIRSLFTDARAPDDLGLPDPRGFWADTYRTGRPTGSLLWLLDRAKKTDETTLLRRAEGYSTDALQWLIDTGVAKTVTATATWLDRTTIGLLIVITKPDATQSQFTFAWSWNGG